MDTLGEMRYKAEFCGARYNAGIFPVGVGPEYNEMGRPNRDGYLRYVEVSLVLGWSSRDHLFDLVLASIAEEFPSDPPRRVYTRSMTPSSILSAVKRAMWKARRGCGCDARMCVELCNDPTA